MSVYVDNARNRFGRMLMNHMVADTTEELLAMVDKIGVRRKWIQKAGTPSEHFDVSWLKREGAIRCGAIPVSCRRLAEITMKKRQAAQPKAPKP